MGDAWLVSHGSVRMVLPSIRNRAVIWPSQVIVFLPVVDLRPSRTWALGRICVGGKTGFLVAPAKVVNLLNNQGRRSVQLLRSGLPARLRYPSVVWCQGLPGICAGLLHPARTRSSAVKLHKAKVFRGRITVQIFPALTSHRKYGNLHENQSALICRRSSWQQ